MDKLNSNITADIINAGGYLKEALENTAYKFYVETEIMSNLEIPHYHRHETTGIEYIAEGKCAHYINGDKYHFDSGCACVMSTVDIHRFKKVSEDNEIRAYYLYFSDSIIIQELLNCISYNNLPIVTRVSGEIKEKLESYFQELLSIYKSPYSLKNKLIAKLRINEIIMLLTTDSEILEVKHRTSQKRITTILSYVRENLSEPISVESIANEFHLNHDYFSRIFIKETGKTFNEYLTTLRIDLAKKILKTNECSIPIVAQMCGFSSATYFIQVFKKITGYTPAKYRKLDI